MSRGSVSRAGVAIMLSVAVVSCQTSRPGENVRPGFDRLEITRSRRELDLSATVIEETRESNNEFLDYSEVRFREQLLWAASGFYYHPRFVDFDLIGRFGLEQRDVESEGSLESSNSDGDTLGYKFGARFFKENAYGFDLFSSRDEVRTRQRFFDINESIRTEYGARLHAREWWLPSRFEASHYRNEGISNFDFLDIRDTFRLEGSKNDAEGSTRYLAEHLEIISGINRDRFNVNRLQASAVRRFGEKNRDSFSSNFQVREQTGFGANSSALFDNAYRHGWTDNLESNFSARLSTNERDDLRTESIGLATSIAHQLFGSLNSGAGLTWNLSDSEGAKFETYSGNGRLAYRKETSLGRFMLEQEFESEIQDRDNLSGVAIVLDEVHVFINGIPIILDNLAVDPLSIVVTDLAGIITYTPGADYIVVQTGAQTRLDIPVGSLIVPGSSILIDYEYQGTPEQEIATTRLSTSMSLTADGIGDINIRHSSTDQTLLDGFDDGTLDDTRRLFASGRVYPIEALTLGAEFEDYDSRIAPYMRTAAFASSMFRPTQRSAWNSSARVYKISYDDGTPNQRGLRIRSSLSTTVATSFRTSLSAEYHRQDYVSDQGSGFMFDFTAQKDFGPTKVELSANYVTEEFEINADQDILRVELHFTRYF